MNEDMHMLALVLLKLSWVWVLWLGFMLTLYLMEGGDRP